MRRLGELGAVCLGVVLVGIATGAMTFLLFDVEIVFLYPWAMVFPNLSEGSGLGPMFLARVLFFILTSVIAFLYAWRKGVFRYD